MAIIQCAECSCDVSDKAVACPKCGNPINTKIARKTITDGVVYGMFKFIIVVALIGILIALLGAGALKSIF